MQIIYIREQPTLPFDPSLGPIKCAVAPLFRTYSRGAKTSGVRITLRFHPCLGQSYVRGANPHAGIYSPFYFPLFLPTKERLGSSARTKANGTAVYNQYARIRPRTVLVYHRKYQGRAYTLPFVPEMFQASRTL